MDGMSNRVRITRWLRGLYSEATEVTAPERLALRHVAVSDRQADVASFSLPTETTEGFDFEDLINRIEEAIDTDIEGLGGVQRYVLVALRQDRSVSRLPLRAALSGEDAAIGEPMESEPATDRGLLAQMMRHNEVMSRMSALTAAQMFGTMQRTIARQQDMLEQHELKRLAAREAVEDALTQEQERNSLAQMAEDNRALKTAVYQTLVNHLPLLFDFVRAAAGGKLGELIKQLADSLRPEQIEALSGVLTPEQMEIVEKLVFARTSSGAPGPVEEPMPDPPPGAPATPPAGAASASGKP